MKKYILSTIIIMFIANSGISLASAPKDFNGENFFRAPVEPVSEQKKEEPEDESEITGTIPPLKRIRLHLKERKATAEIRKAEKEKRKAVKKALKAYKKNKSLEDAQLLDIPTGADIEHLEMAGVEQTKSPQRIVITCDDMDYSTETAILNANGHVKVNFIEENATLFTDHLVYDKRSKHITAIGSVVIQRDGLDVKGESISIDMNEENALIDKPLSKFAEISISAERGYVYKNRIVQENGAIDVDSSFPINIKPHGKAPKLDKMMIEEGDKATAGNFIDDSNYRVKVSQIIINSDKKLESIELKKAQIYHGNKKVFVLPWVRLYTNKNHDFVDGDFPELGSKRNIGLYAGPGWVLKMPFGSILKLAPIVTYRNKFGFGGFARFLSGTNTTEVAYGTSQSKFIVTGEQELDDHLKLQYAANEYLDNWFLGRRLARYGANLIYERSYNHKDFLYKNLDMRFTHNASFGLFKDPDKDKYYKKIHGGNHTTIRARYMAEVEQKLISFENKEKLANAYLSIVGQGSASLYGTGDTQFIGRIGPRLHTQYKRWMQDIGYFQSAYDDHTPLPVFDMYRYGRSNAYVREYLRVCKYLTLSWLGSFSFSDDKLNNSIMQECSFFVSIGPDDLKLHVGYDVVRENAYVNFSVGLDTKGSAIKYDKLEIKNPENFKGPEKHTYYVGEVKEDTTPKILKQAIVEEIDPLEETDEEL